MTAMPSALVLLANMAVAMSWSESGGSHLDHERIPVGEGFAPVPQPRPRRHDRHLEVLAELLDLFDRPSGCP